MIYVLETKIRSNKSVFISLQRVYGIGESKAKLICKNLGFSENLKVKNLTEKQQAKILNFTELKKIITGSELRQKLKIINKKLTNMKSYRGLRRIDGLPVRGQRTHTNSKSSKKRKKLKTRAQHGRAFNWFKSNLV